MTCYQHYDMFKAARAKIRFTLASMCFAGVDEAKYEAFYKSQGRELAMHFRSLRYQRKPVIFSDYFMERFMASKCEAAVIRLNSLTCQIFFLKQLALPSNHLVILASVCFSIVFWIVG